MIRLGNAAAAPSASIYPCLHPYSNIRAWGRVRVGCPGARSPSGMPHVQGPERTANCHSNSRPGDPTATILARNTLQYIIARAASLAADCAAHGNARVVPAPVALIIHKRCRAPPHVAAPFPSRPTARLPESPDRVPGPENDGPRGGCRTELKKRTATRYASGGVGYMQRRGGPGRGASRSPGLFAEGSRCANR